MVNVHKRAISFPLFSCSCCSQSPGTGTELVLRITSAAFLAWLCAGHLSASVQERVNLADRGYSNLQVPKKGLSLGLAFFASSKKNEL